MTFEEAEQQYAELQRQWQEQSLERTAFIEAVNQLRLQDDTGDWWQIRGADGAWLRWDGETWHELPRPAASTPPPPAAPRVDETIIESEWHLIPLQGGQAYPLFANTIIGRDPRCDITISDPKVSRQHAQIKPFQDTWVVQDQGSSNGTYVNEMQITQPTVIQAGTHLKIGDKVFVLHDQGEKSLNPAYIHQTPAPAALSSATPAPYVPTPAASPSKPNRLWSCLLLFALLLVCIVASIGIGLYLVNNGLVAF